MKKICDCVKIIHMLKTALGTDAIANGRRNWGGGTFQTKYRRLVRGSVCRPMIFANS